MVDRGLNKEQSHRVLENLQRIALSLKQTDHLSDMVHEEALRKAFKNSYHLNKEEVDTLYRNIEGMLNGNNGGANEPAS